jgi:hypothetical protein
MASSTDRLGEPARVERKWEMIGPLDCPLMFRRTLLAGRLGKLLVHRFVPGASDKDPHDHPRGFVTVVVRGGYDDVNPAGTVERLRAPAIRYRPATHCHVTNVHADGALTVVVMGPLVRAWGFVRDGHWWPWPDYERRFGLGFRCEDLPPPPDLREEPRRG